ncbi:hypothetical protein KP509_36G048500 [Ceratopteris richardii]|uniref:SAM domain-containing protein n=1 Tax=Ceratopteris richardii TaxID=49495 RepID=A0A8T2QCX5_CERRI|nr:hypothetical protein KP509_36G048500 [Ceratopteris richardii]
MEELAPSSSQRLSPQQRWKELQEKVKSLAQGNELNAWLRKQSAPVEVVLTTVINGAQGAALGALMGVLTRDIRSAFPTPAQGISPEAMASLQQAQALAGGPLVQARNFAVMTGTNSGIACAMRRARGGVDDLQTSVVSAFGSGALFSLVSGVGGPDKFSNAVMTGAFFALIQGGMYQLGKAAQPPPNDLFYVKGRMMLHDLGLQRYEKNFKKGLLTDTTLTLLNDSALQDAKIPPGPRLLILDYVRRNHHELRTA